MASQSTRNPPIQQPSNISTSSSSTTTTTTSNDGNGNGNTTLWSLVRHAHTTAYAVVNAHRTLQASYSERFYRLCPQDDTSQYTAHTVSIDRILNYCAQSEDKDLGMTLYPAQRIPREMIYLCIDKQAYDEYHARHWRLLEEYRERKLREWERIRENLSGVLRGVSPPVGEGVRQCIRWWGVFKGDMRVYEEAGRELEVGGFEEITEELARAVREAVEVDGDGDGDEGLEGIQGFRG